ncbi:MAG: S41 family peptidase, partial [Vallitaleaceae bacterium]|nr:S41 family peptidase [Vallitaleaceae bacterium]
NYSGSEVTRKELFEAAMKGMTGILDDYSVFYTEEESKTFLDSLSSNYVGIGVQIQSINNQLVITEVFEGGAAKESGIQVNDIIFKVENESIEGFDMNTVVSKIVGEEGTYVNIEFMRGSESLVLELERRKIHIPTVVRKNLDEVYPEYAGIMDRVAFVEISSFSDETDEDMALLSTQLQAEGIEFLIIDMRGNGGGYLQTAINLGNLLIPKGQILRLVDKKGIESIYESPLEKAPFSMAILVDEQSASATEIFSAAAQDSKIATIIGETTYGKGVAQYIFPLASDHLVKLTSQEFYSRENKKINGVGVIPDIEVKNPNAIYSEIKLYSGDQNEEVEQVEEILSYLGYFKEKPDQKFDYKTAAAVKAFQSEVGLYSYGVCDFTTQRKLNEELNKELAVKDLQIHAALEFALDFISTNE